MVVGIYITFFGWLSKHNYILYRYNFIYIVNALFAFWRVTPSIKAILLKGYLVKMIDSLFSNRRVMLDKMVQWKLQISLGMKVRH